MVAILALLIVYGLRRTLDFAFLDKGYSEEKNTLCTSMGARNISLADDPNTLAAYILGYFAMVWPAHVFLQLPPSSLTAGWVIGNRWSKNV